MQFLPIAERELRVAARQPKTWSRLQLAFVALALVNIMFLSLAVGTCASAQFSSGRSSLAVTVGVLVFVTFGVALLALMVLDAFFAYAFFSEHGGWG